MRAVIITAQNFQDEEVTYPYYRLLEEGIQVDVATPDKKEVFGKYGVPARPTMDTNGLVASEYDLVILPGGFEAPDRLRLRKEVLSFVKEMFDSGKIVAAICHGPWLCVSAGILKGRRATAFQSIADDIRNAGAVYCNENVVVDGNLVTSPHYRNNGDFMKAILNLLKTVHGASK